MRKSLSSHMYLPKEVTGIKRWAAWASFKEHNHHSCDALTAMAKHRVKDRPSTAQLHPLTPPVPPLKSQKSQARGYLLPYILENISTRYSHSHKEITQAAQRFLSGRMLLRGLFSLYISRLKIAVLFSVFPCKISIDSYKPIFRRAPNFASGSKYNFSIGSTQIPTRRHESSAWDATKTPTVFYVSY